MEIDVDFDFELTRIALAFEIADQLEVVQEPLDEVGIFRLGSRPELEWKMRLDTGEQCFTWIGDGRDLAYSPQLGVHPNIAAPEAAHWMARGCFKLGYSIQKLEEFFGPLLSGHEQLQCREELPREFWPLAWKAPVLQGEW